MADEQRSTMDDQFAEVDDALRMLRADPVAFRVYRFLEFVDTWSRAAAAVALFVLGLTVIVLGRGRIPLAVLAVWLGSLKILGFLFHEVTSATKDRAGGTTPEVGDL